MNRRINIFANIDWITIILYVLIVFMGWVNIYSAVYNENHNSILDTSQRYGKQLIWIATALILIILTFTIDSKFYSSFAYVLYGVGVLLLLGVLLVGIEVNASKSWYEIGSIRLQPVEFTKITFCLAIAQFLSSKNFSFNKPNQLLMLGILFALPLLIIFIQNDTGSALVFFSFIFVLYREGLNRVLFITAFVSIALFVFALILDIEVLFIIIYIICILAFMIVSDSKQAIKRIFIISAFFSTISLLTYYFTNIFEEKTGLLILINTFIVSASMLIMYLKKPNKSLILFASLLMGISLFVLSANYIFNDILQPHQQNRINELLGKNDDPLGVGYNLNQSRIAIGSGGFFGKGFLNGTQTKYNFVPEQSTDFIFCTIGEEWGFLGTTTVLFLFTFLILRIIFLAERQRSAFSRIYGYGVASILFFHIAINISMTIGLAPVIGIPLPFFSYGGSSLWAFSLLLFIFLKLDSDRLQVFR